MAEITNEEIKAFVRKHSISVHSILRGAQLKKSDDAKREYLYKKCGRHHDLIVVERYDDFNGTDCEINDGFYHFIGLLPSGSLILSDALKNDLLGDERVKDRIPYRDMTSINKLVKDWKDFCNQKAQRKDGIMQQVLSEEIESYQ